MKLGFITAIREDTWHPREYALKRVAVNLAPLYLSGFLQNKGFSVEIQIKDELESLAHFQPDFLGISSVTENIPYARELARAAKERWNPVLILGGVHLTALPRGLPPEFDLGVVGEGEETLADLVTLWQKKGRLDAEDLKSIPGLVFRNGGGLQFTGYRKGVAILDEIPAPDRKNYIKKSAVTYMMTSRGCPYTCSFCVIPSTSEGYRMHSPRYVVEEIRSIREHYPDVNNIRIFDDLYIVNRRRVREIAELVQAEGLSHELSFGCWGRANLIDSEMIESFKKMNMVHVAFGAESGSSRVLSQIKPGCSVEDNQKAIDLLHAEGIKIACSVILGHPSETEDDLWATYEFIESNLDRLFDVEFNVAIPWPGTELWNQAQSRGLVHEQMDFSPLKECAYFPNYCTDLYPYLNEKINPERFDQILVEFKKLHQVFYRRNVEEKAVALIGDGGDIARYF